MKSLPFAFLLMLAISAPSFANQGSPSDVKAFMNAISGQRYTTTSDSVFCPTFSIISQGDGANYSLDFGKDVQSLDLSNAEIGSQVFGGGKILTAQSETLVASEPAGVKDSLFPTPQEKRVLTTEIKVDADGRLVSIDRSEKDYEKHLFIWVPETILQPDWHSYCAVAN